MWFITAGGAFFAAWPAVYAAAFSGFYMAMLLVLFALFFRPVGFDYRSKIEDPRWRTAWDWGLFLGGAIPALIFGVAFGNLLQGVPFHLDDLLRVTLPGQPARRAAAAAQSVRAAGGRDQPGHAHRSRRVWLQLRADDPVASRARRTIVALAPLVALAFLARRRLAMVRHRRLSHRLGARAWRLPIRWTSKSSRVAHAWFDIYRRLPVAMIAPALGVLGPLVTALLSPKRAPRPGFLPKRAGHVRNHRRRRSFDVSLRHAVEPRSQFRA